MNATAVEEMLLLAKRLAVEAAEVSLAGLGKTSQRRKADGSIVTDVDEAIQKRITRAVIGRYPDHAVLGEETVEGVTTDVEPASARYCWVVDPLDGTRNYASGFPCFATSIGVLDEGRPIVAVVHEHVGGRMHTAVLGGGTRTDGDTCRVSESSDDDDILIGVPSSKDRLSVGVLRRWMVTSRLNLRNLGSTATHLAMVGSGALHAAFAKQCKIWDLAAGVLLVTEAGGQVTDPRGGDLLPFDLKADPDTDLPFLAAWPSTHARLLATVREEAG